MTKYKASLSESEMIKAAYLHYVRGVSQQDIAIAFEVNLGRVNEACLRVLRAIRAAEDDLANGQVVRLRED